MGMHGFKKRIVQCIVTIILSLGMLSCFFGISDLGKMTVYAEGEFPEDWEINDEFYKSFSYDPDYSGAFAVFCDTEAVAETAINKISNTVYYEDLIAELNAIREDGNNNIRCQVKYADMENDGLEGNMSVRLFPPTQDSEYYAVKYWKRKAEWAPKVFSGQHLYDIAVFVAAYDVYVRYDTEGGTETGGVQYTPIFTDSSSRVSVTLKDETSTTRNGYTLSGWRDDILGTEYDPGEAMDLTFRCQSIIALKADWEEIPKVTITYRPNGGTGSALNETMEFETDDGGDFGSIDLRSSADFARDGYTLAGWRVTEPGKTNDVEEFALGAECTFSANADNLVFDAIWERSSVDVSVQYKPNGGTGDVVKQNERVTISANSSSVQVKLLDKADFKRAGYTLTGWSDGSRTYDLGATYTFTVGDEDTAKSLAFDAVWTEKTKGTVEISIKKPAYVGAKIEYDIEKNSKGDVKVEYKKKGAKDDDYSKKAPTEPGKYTARATLEETDEYTSAEDTTDFELVYLDAPESPFTYTEIKDSAGTVTDLNVVPASGYSIGLTGAADASFGSSVLYSAAKKAGGVYLKRDKDDAITEQVQMTAYTVTDKPSITVTPASATSATSAASGKIYYGTQYNVTVTSLSPAEKTITYKKAGTGGTYSAVMPTAPGTYTVRVTATATDYYAAVDKTADFTIEYLEAPANVVELKGTPGTGGWYKSDVTLEAPAGYRISTSADGTFGESIKWNDGITEIYYQRTSDNAKTNAVQVSFNVKIDKDMPTAVFDSSLGISGKEKSLNVYADSLTFKISDDNLKSVKVNGDLHNVTGKEWTVELKSGLLSETNTIVATDEAGNEYTLEVTLSPAWRQSMEVPMGREVCLLAGEGYKLSSKCKLEDKTKDTTVYAKGVTVYVRKDETCSFTEVDGK